MNYLPYFLIFILLIPLCWFIPPAYLEVKSFEWNYANELKERTRPVEVEEVEIITVVMTTEMSIEDTKSYIRGMANNYGVDPDLALMIADAESDFRNVCNYNGCQYGQGIFQFIPSSWDYVMGKMNRTGDPMNITLNIRAAMFLLSTEGTKHWNQSIESWGKYYD